jgi:hypothetical protein
MALTLAWLDQWGAVRFVADSIPAGSTVFIIAPGDHLQMIRGYEDDTWHSAGGAGLGYSFEMPLGVPVRYGIAPVTAQTWPGTGVEATIVTPGGEAWLRDLYLPDMSQQVVVLSTGEESRPARQSVLRISGRERPVVLWDVREGRQGIITLRVTNMPSARWDTTYRDKIDALLNTGRPLLLSMCHSKGFPPCYMAVQDASYTRVELRAQWKLELNYVEIDNPVDVPVMIPPEITYEQRMIGDPSYADWAASYNYYGDLAVVNG